MKSVKRTNKVSKILQIVVMKNHQTMIYLLEEILMNVIENNIQIANLFKNLNQYHVVKEEEQILIQVVIKNQINNTLHNIHVVIDLKLKLIKPEK